MTSPGTPKASQAAITAVQEALGCRREQFMLQSGDPWGCATHAGYRVFEWTERGCPVAVAAADAAAPHNAADALREAARDPELRLGGHSGVSIRGLRNRADRIEAS